jgi:thiol-disulfide isomerase/thioredoxin
MKHLIIVTLIVHFFLSSSGQIKELQPGHLLPNISVLMQDKQGKFVDFSTIRHKLIILNFWSIICKSCIAEMPRMDSLQEEFKNDIEIVYVTRNSSKQVDDLFKRISIKRPNELMINGDTLLSKLFPHQTVPHHVWINKKGIVEFITSDFNTNKKFLLSYLKGNKLSLERKTSTIFNFATKLITDSSTMMNFKNYSILFGYSPNIGISTVGGGGDSLRGTSQLRFTNQPLLRLYQMAFNGAFSGGDLQWNNRVILNTKDSLRFIYPSNLETVQQWTKGNSFCYESLFPYEAKSSLFKIFREDLERYFPYKVFVEKREIHCLALVQLGEISASKEKKSSYSNEKGCVSLLKATPESITNTLRSFFRNHNDLPIVNEVSFNYGIDFKLCGKFTDVNLLNKALREYNLHLEEKDVWLDMLVIND